MATTLFAAQGSITLEGNARNIENVVGRVEDIGGPRIMQRRQYRIDIASFRSAPSPSGRAQPLENFLPANRRFDPNRRYVPPGDYITDSLKSLELDPNSQGLVRIFLKDPRGSADPATLERVNEFGRPINLQILYNGTRRIVLLHNSRINGLIYAPCASIVTDGNNHHVSGAIVCDTMKAEGNTMVEYDVALSGTSLQKFNPKISKNSQGKIRRRI